MSLLLAVLEKRGGYYFANLDAYINVVGGLRLDEPATDLAVAMALVSSLKDVPIGDDALAFGERSGGGKYARCPCGGQGGRRPPAWASGAWSCRTTI